MMDIFQSSLAKPKLLAGGLKPDRQGLIQADIIYSGESSPDVSGGDVPPPAVITSKFLASENHVAFLKDNSFYHCGIKELQGNGNVEDVLTFTKQSDDVKDAVISPWVSIYLTNSGDVYGTYGQDGSLGINSSNPVYTFINIANNIKKINNNRSVYSNTMLITNDDELFLAGDNTYGIQGDGTTKDNLTFHKVAENVADCAGSGFNTYYLTNSGELYGCGININKQISNSSTSPVKSFAKIADNVKSFSVYDSSLCFIDNNNDLYCRGENSFGQFGLGHKNNVAENTKIAENIKEFRCELASVFYIDSNNNLYGAGLNSNGSFGIGDISSVTTFTKLAEDVKTFNGNYRNFFYINNKNELYGAGNGEYHGFGINNTNKNNTFVKIADDAQYVVQQADAYHFWYVDTKGKLYGCGKNSYGQQGNGTTTDIFVLEEKVI